MPESAKILSAALVFGLFSAMPTGPVAFLIIKNTLKFNARAGFVTLLSLSTGAAVYILLFLLGLGSLILDANWIRWPMFLAGAVLLIVLGVQAWRDEAAEDPDAEVEDKSLGAMFREGFFVTVLNPAILLLFAALLRSVEEVFGEEPVRELLLPLLVMQEVGVALWFAVVIAAVTLLPDAVATRLRRVIGRFAGVCLGAFGMWLVYSTVGEILAR